MLHRTGTYTLVMLVADALTYYQLRNPYLMSLRFRSR